MTLSTSILRRVALLVMIVATFSEINTSFLVDAKREMIVVDELIGPALLPKLQPSVIDTQNSAAYFGTYTDPGQVCKFNISSANISFVSCIAAPSGVGQFYSAVIDSHNSAAYFGTYTNPGQACKYNISSTNFSFVSCIAAPTGANSFVSAVIDTQNSALYFGTDTNPGQSCKYNISSTNFSFVSCIAAPTPKPVSTINKFRSAVIDTKNSAAYFGTITHPGQVCKYNISSANFSFVSCAIAPYGVNYFYAATIDTQNSAVYVGTNTPGQACRFNVSSANFSFVSCAAAPPGVQQFDAATVDTQSSAAYFGTDGSPPQVCKFQISPSDFSCISCIPAPNGTHLFKSAVVDTGNSAAYFGTSDQVCTYNISSANFSFVSCTAPPPEPFSVSSVVIDTQNSAAYYGAGSNPTKVCKYNISSANFSFVSCIEAPSVVARAFSLAVIDTHNAAAYFGTPESLPSSPAQVCKYNISSSNFSFVSCISAPLNPNNIRVPFFYSAVIDTKNSAAYFGTGSAGRGQVCQYNISSANFSFVSCAVVAPGSAANRFYSAVIDTKNSAAYFGSPFSPGDDSTGQVCKFSISPAEFTFVSCAVAPSGVTRFNSAVIDTKNSAAYFSAYTNPGQVCKFSISPTDFSFVSCITVPSGVNYFSSAVIDTQNSAAYFGSDTTPGQICKVNTSSSTFSFVSCITTSSGVGRFESAIIDTRNSAAYFVFAPVINNPVGIIILDLNVFACNSDGRLEIGQDDVLRSDPVRFSALHGCNVTMTSATVSSINFFERIGNSTITLRNITSTSTDSFIRLASSNPFLSPSTMTLENNQFHGNQLLSSPSDGTLSNSFWSLKCNRWVNGYNNALNKFASQRDAEQFIWNCPQTLTTTQTLTASESGSASLSASSSPSKTWSDTETVSPSFSASNSLSYSGSSSLSETSTESPSSSRSFSQSESLSSSTSFSDSVYCTNLDEFTCNNTPSRQCKFCPTTNICVERDQRCDSCTVLNKQFCAFTQGRCKFCPEHQVCVNATTTPTCDCVSFSSSACAVANSTCNYCPSESVCVLSQQSCGCLNFTSTISLNNSNAYCDASPVCQFCPQQQTCLPQSTPCTCHDMNQEQCAISFLSPQTDNSCKYCSNISFCAPKKINCACMALPDQSVCNVATGCHWCSNHSTCAPKDTWPDCNCETLNNSDFCSIISNNNCQWCSNSSVCADPEFDCECELFSESVCSTSQCKWCDNMNTCTVQENKNCECYYLKSEQKCSTASNDKCSWCPKSDPIGSYPVDGVAVSMNKHFQVTSDFNYCVNKTADRCECSYLPNEFCQFASSSSASSSSNYSSTCKYCSNLNLCTRADENTNCDCGQEYSPRGCSLTPSCMVLPPVLTVSKDSSPYCALNSPEHRDCRPVACQGIKTEFSCIASGCTFVNLTETTGTCGTGDCFNFFVPGFTPQPFLLYFIGLFKDVIVVLLIGAIGDIFTRPIMNVVFKVKKKIKDWDHIERRIKDQTLYMSDRICREGYSFSFSEYVEQICEDVFEFVDEEGHVQVLDEQHRLALFDITAFCLFDNMLWIEPVFDDDESENNKIVPKEREQTAANENSNHSLNTDDEGNSAPPKREKLTDGVASATENKSGKNDDQMNSDSERNTPTPTATAPSLPAPQSARRNRGFSMRTQKSADTYSPPNNDQFDDVENTNSSIALAAAAIVTPRNPENINEVSPCAFGAIRLNSEDFGSLVTLRSKVQETLLQRGSSFIYYAQSRNKVVAACAAINSFPTALQLIGYIIVVSVLYVTSFITVAGFRSITQVVSGCNSFTPLNSGVTIGGAFLLLGFRLMNASAEATSILIFVKTIRGLFQKFTGLHDLTFQQRIPLMGLFTDRPIQITLLIYTLMIAPFALAGPFYGTSIDYRCLVPVLIGLGVLIVDWIALFGIRRYSRNQRVLRDQEKTKEYLRQVRADQLLQIDERLQGDNDDENQSPPPETPTNKVTSSNHNASELEDFEEMVTDSHFSEVTTSEVSLSMMVNSSTKTSSKLQRNKRRQKILQQSADGVIDEKLAHQITIASAAPIELGKAILVFLMTEELPVIAISLALQVSFNYMCLLHFGSAFGIGKDEGDLVYSKDYDNRRLECLWEHFLTDASHAISMLSSILPF